MVEKLCSIIEEEINLLRNLLNILEKQYLYIIQNDIFAMEKCVGEIEDSGKYIAECEIRRRDITKGKSMKQIEDELNDKRLKDLRRDINKIIHEVKLQKDTNEILLRQGLGFTNNMLNILNPDKTNNKLYNSYGKVSR